MNYVMRAKDQIYIKLKTGFLKICVLPTLSENTRIKLKSSFN